MLSEFVDHEFHGRKKKKSREISRGGIYPRNHGTSARFFDLISFQFARVISLDGSAVWFKLRQLVVTRPEEEASYKKKKKKKRQMRRFLKCGENSVRNLCPFKCEIQIAVKLHLYERNSNIWLVWTLSSRIFRNYYYGTDGMKLHVDGVPYILTYLSFHFKHLNRLNPHANVFLFHCIYVFDESNHILAEI